MEGKRFLVWREGENLPQELPLLLRKGGVVVIPTDTLYALAARAFSSEALERIYEIKKRGRGKAFSLFFGRVEELEDLFILSPLAAELIRCYLPGPLTLVLKPKIAFPPLLLGPTGGVGVRIPAHPLPRMLVETLGEPVTATSANVSGSRDPLTVDELSFEILSRADLVVDGGRVLGIPSTVVDLTGRDLKVLREGAIPARELEEVAYG